MFPVGFFNSEDNTSKEQSVGLGSLVCSAPFFPHRRTGPWHFSLSHYHPSYPLNHATKWFLCGFQDLQLVSMLLSSAEWLFKSRAVRQSALKGERSIFVETAEAAETVPISQLCILPFLFLAGGLVQVLRCVPLGWTSFCELATFLLLTKCLKDATYRRAGLF